MLFSELGLRPDDPAVGRLTSTLQGLFDKNNSVVSPPSKGQTDSRDALVQESARLKHTTLTRRPWRYPNLTQAEIATYQQRIDQITNSSASDGSIRLTWATACSRRGRSAWTRYTARSDCCTFRKLTDQSVLDLGSWDGFYAFEAEQRGAARVLATDSFSWNGMGWSNKQGFLLARDILRSQVEDMDIDIMDVCPERVGLFDVVLFSGMLYHMRDPIKALQNAASVCKKQLIVETAVGMEDVKEPVLAYLPRVHGEEQSNFWRPNPALVNLWLKELGFRKIDYRVNPDPRGPLGFFNAFR